VPSWAPQPLSLHFPPPLPQTTSTHAVCDGISEFQQPFVIEICGSKRSRRDLNLASLRNERLFSLSKCSNRILCSPCLLFNWYQPLFMGKNAAWIRVLRQFHLASSLRMSGHIPRPSPYDFLHVLVRPYRNGISMYSCGLILTVTGVIVNYGLTQPFYYKKIFFKIKYLHISIKSLLGV
jgi:hypothetical protein